MNDMQPITHVEVDVSELLSIIKDRVKYSTGLGLKPITECEAWRDNNNIAIVGGGPSLKDNLNELRKFKYIMACGSVHDYLIRNGIYPTWTVICDPDPCVVDYLQQANIVTEYLVASQCHQNVFEHLKYKKTYLWHAGGSTEENVIAQFPDNDYIIGGGCTVGTRAIIMAMGFGFHNLSLFGMDSSIKDDAHHAYDFVNETETLGDVYEIKVDNGESPTFKVAGYMLAQIKDFQTICNLYSQTLKFKIYGDGLLAYIVKLAEKQALELKEVS